ncbi:MAG: DUF7847 domain-containing protein [Anaerolineae bacterium]
MGIIDTLSDGFDRVTRRLWLLLVPILVDLGIWLGPKLSIRGLSQGVLAALPNASELGTQYEQTLELIQARFTELSASTNILTLLSMRFLGLPSLSGSLASEKPPFGIAQRLIEIPTWPTLLGFAVLLILLSFFLGCFCLSLIAQEVREEEPDLAYVLQVTWRSWLRLVKLLSIILLLAAMISSGVGTSIVLLSIISQELSWLALNLFSWMALPIWVYVAIILFFTSRAIILDDMGIMRSLWNSFHVVHRNFFGTIGFILLINIIQTGLWYIWRMLAINTVGTFIGIMGNAYVSTGLVVASFLFYRDRLVAGQQAKVEEGKR